MAAIFGEVDWPGGRFTAELVEDRGNGVCLMKTISKHARVSPGHNVIVNKKHVREWKDADGNKVPAP